MNLRDLGGLPLVNGGHTRSGVLYRGDAPHQLDDRPPVVDAWPPALVIDLRVVAETARWPAGWTEATRVIRCEIQDRAHAMADGTDADFVRSYPAMVVAAGPSIAALISELAGPEEPILVHCAAGKDRTGVVVLVLLLAAGVRPDALLADYAITEANMASLLHRWVARGRAGVIPEDWLHTSVPAAQAVLDLFEGSADRARAWLVAQGAGSADVGRWTAKVAAHMGTNQQEEGVVV